MMIKTIAEAAEYLSAYMIIDDIPEGDASHAFRLSTLRTCHIGPLKQKLTWLVASGELTARTPAGTSLNGDVEPSDSTLIEVEEAKAVLDADAPFGKLFENERAALPGADSPVSLAERVENEEEGWPSDAELAEYITNGAFINWIYWVGKMPSLTTQQAVRLMSGLDPDIFESLDVRPNQNDETRRCTHAKYMERLAIAEQKTALSPGDWLRWADRHHFKVHEVFRDSVYFSGTDKQTKSPAPYEWPAIEAQQNKANCNGGRYTIREAAELLRLHAGERADTMIEKLSKAAFDGKLPVHRPGEKARLVYPEKGMDHSNSSMLPGGISYYAGENWRQHVRDFYEEAYWDDLNAWLAVNEPRLDWTFPSPQQPIDGVSLGTVAAQMDSQAPVPVSGLGRKEILSVDWPLINGFTEDSLSRALSDVPKWLMHARIASGAPGKGSALWNPAVVAACLLEKRYARQTSLTNLMRKSFPDWLEQWGKIQEQ